MEKTIVYTFVSLYYVHIRDDMVRLCVFVES